MKHSRMHEMMRTIIWKEVMKVRDEGQKEYAHDEDDVFANFNRIAHLLDEDRKKVLMTYMLKHVDGIAAYVKGHKSQREDVTGRITDCIVYLMLLWGMIEEENGTIFREKGDAPLHDVFKAISNKDKRLFMDGGCSAPNGIQADDNLQKVRQTRSRFKKPEEMGSA